MQWSGGAMTRMHVADAKESANGTRRSRALCEDRLGAAASCDGRGESVRDAGVGEGFEKAIASLSSVSRP